MVSGRFGNAFSHCLIQFACKDSVSHVLWLFKVLQFSNFGNITHLLFPSVFH